MISKASLSLLFPTTQFKFVILRDAFPLAASCLSQVAKFGTWRLSYHTLHRIATKNEALVQIICTVPSSGSLFVDLSKALLSCPGQAVNLPLHPLCQPLPKDQTVSGAFGMDALWPSLC